MNTKQTSYEYNKIINSLLFSNVSLIAKNNTDILTNDNKPIQKNQIIDLEKISQFDGENVYLFLNCLTSCNLEYLLKNFNPYIK